MKEYDVLIIGGGPAGYTAALYAARAGLTVAVLEKLCAGGQMALTSHIENYPGFEDAVDGFELGEKMQQSAEKQGAHTILTEVLSVQLAGEWKLLHTSDGDFCSRAVIIATGAEPKKLGLPLEKELTGRGVHYCAACDGMFYRDKTVMIVGGGNSAAEDALLLSRVARKVILVHRRDHLRAEKAYQEQLEKAGNIEFLWNSKVSALSGVQRLSGVLVESVQTGQSRQIPCDGLFISIGRSPVTTLVQGELELDEAGYIRADESTRTNLPGVFAAGDVRTKALRQIVTAAADGAAAVHGIEEYLAG